MTRKAERRTRIHPLTIAALAGTVGIVAATSPAAAGDQEPVEVTYPKFQILRFSEDWSDFDATLGDDYWDGIKHMKINDDGSSWVGLGGELRYRSETWESFGFSDAPAANDTFGLARAQFYTDWHFGESLRVFIEAESAFATDRDLPGGRRGLDVDQLDLQNAFVEFDVPFGESKNDLSVRLGRQGLLFGRQRLVSTLPWANSQRSWDGARLTYKTGDWTIDGFYTRYAPVKKYEFNDWESGPDFWGIHATTKLGSNKDIGLDAYLFVLDSDASVTINGDTGSQTRYTLGSRINGKVGDSGVAYDVEAAYQLGEVGSADVNAYMLATEISYTYAEAGWKPKVYAGLDYSSGDDSAGDGDIQTFNQLFPLGHAYNGYMDLIGRQNIVDLSFGVTLKPHDRVTLKADFHHFTRASDSDSVYNAGGGVLRATSPGASDDVGQEFDLTVKYSVDRHMTLQGGYSHFFAGDYFSDTGADEDIDFYYLQAVYKF